MARAPPAWALLPLLLLMFHLRLHWTRERLLAPVFPPAIHPYALTVY
jgi:hypothetical protein